MDRTKVIIFSLTSNKGDAELTQTQARRVRVLSCCLRLGDDAIARRSATAAVEGDASTTGAGLPDHLPAGGVSAEDGSAVAVSERVQAGELYDHCALTHAHARRAAKGDLAALRLAGQHGEAVALGGGGEGDDGRLLLHPVQARQAVARERLQGGLAALPQRFEDQD